MTLEDFIAKWKNVKGGRERADFQPFMSDFFAALGIDGPPPGSDDYRYEAPVSFADTSVDKAHGRIDLYKRGHFVLEAKQSRLGAGEKTPAEPARQAPVAPVTFDLFGAPVAAAAAPAVRPRVRAYDRLMEGALRQAKDYALALPADHGWPPFLIVADVGRAFELFFDWAGNGKGYGFFPDQAAYRIELDDLRRKDVRDRLTGIWTDPASIDPRLQAVAVTRDIAVRLARVSKRLDGERRGQLLGHRDDEVSAGIEETALFLMRMLFCMFAEDVGLLPEKSFQTLLAAAIDRSDQYWQSQLSTLWALMNRPGTGNRYWADGDAQLRYFNGNLFGNAHIYSLPKEEKRELLAAAECDWKAVEPAIFGTLLEQALTPTERAKLGAHYTPRPYVERLVEATMMEVLRAEWEAVRAPPLPGGSATGPSPSGGEGSAAGASGPTLAAVAAFHDRIAAVHVLDPACGTGNFLYVAMENLLRLETDVIVLIEQLGGSAAPRVGPEQFLGIELNPRAAVIAELVLWIGWLRYRLANDPASVGEPVLQRLHNINGGAHGGVDALLAADPATGAADLDHPRPRAWPAAEFIIGNPPFIGSKYLREQLGSDYAEALWKAAPGVPKSADLVMQWWDRAAAILTAPQTVLRRFGFVTTNSITQSFSRRVIAAWLAGERPLSLRLAIGDHPWTRASKDAAAVRIAMTVAQAGTHPGTLIEIVSESGLDTDAPALGERQVAGIINADLSVGTDVTAARSLLANAGLSSPGVKLHGAGFIVTPEQAAALGLGTRPGLEAHIRPYRNGRDLLQRSRGVMVIDLFGLSEKMVRERFPEVYQHLLKTVKPERDENRRASYRDRWWLFGEARSQMRPALQPLKRFIVTIVTAKHRIFSFVDRSILADDALITIAFQDSYYLGVLSSDPHLRWTYERCSLIGIASFEKGHRYNNSLVFDPFPFPDATPDQRARIAELAEELDLTRRVALDENAGLTMTGLYNLVVQVRDRTLAPADEATATRARARIVAKLHDDLDAAVAAAYGWPAGLSAPDIVARLVALNAERTAEEAAGRIRWLRPDYQAARFGSSKLASP